MLSLRFKKYQLKCSWKHMLKSKGRWWATFSCLSNSRHPEFEFRPKTCVSRQRLALLFLSPLRKMMRHRLYNTPESLLSASSPHSQWKTPWSESASELYRPSDRRLSAKIAPTFSDRGCHVVSVTNPHDRIFGFLDRSRDFFLQTSPQLYSRDWVDPIPDPLLLRKSGSAGNRTGISGSVARNSDH
jgi:hypothetical protein